MRWIVPGSLLTCISLMDLDLLSDFQLDLYPSIFESFLRE
jgi:hypothetical protein